MTMVKAVQTAARRRRQLRTPNPAVRQQFLDAAAKLIHDEGFQAMTVEEIALRANLSIGSFYLYFESKDDLFVNLVIEHTERLALRLENAVSEGRTAMESLELALDAYLDFVKETERGFLYYRDMGNVETTVGPLTAWAFNHTARPLRPVLERAMAQGEIRRCDPDLLAQSLVGLTQHIAGYWLQHQDLFTREQVKEFLSNFIARGIRRNTRAGANASDVGGNSQDLAGA